MKFRLCLGILLGCLVGLLAHAQTAKSTRADYIVALVNSQPITNAELRLAMQRTTEQLQAEGKKVATEAALREQVLERLISEKAQLDYAEQTGVRIEESAIDQAELAMARQGEGSLNALRQRLENEGSSASALREQLREQMMLTRVRERDVDSRIRISDPDIDRYLAELRSNSKDPLTQEINLAQILLPVPEKASAEQTARVFLQAQQLRERAVNGEDFATLVQQYSAADRSNGGEIGLRRGDRYPQIFIDALQDLGPGELTQIVRSGAGFHILKVIERRAPPNYVHTVVQTRARHILLRTSPTLTQAAAISRLNEFKQQIQSGKANFANLAREHSQDGSAEQGGDLGWVGPGIFVPEFESVMSRLAEGEISSPVVSRFGVHLIQTLDRRRVDLNPRELREFARDKLRATRAEEAYQTWSRDIRERAYVEMREPSP